MKKIDAHAHVFDHIGSMGKAGELRPLGNGNCRWATGEEFRIIPEGKGDKEYLVETFMDVMDENDVEKAILLQGVLYGLQNEYAMECAEKYPDRFKAAVMLDPFCRCAQQILEHFINDLHAHVFKFEVSVGGGLSGYHRDFAVDGPEMTVLIDRIAQVEDATLVLDIGSPSGTAMTMIATEIMKTCSTCCEIDSQSCSSNPPTKIALPSMTQKIVHERAMPTLPISRERRVSCRSSGVGSSVCTVDCSVTRPASVWSPTAVTTSTP